MSGLNRAVRTVEEARRTIDRRTRARPERVEATDRSGTITVVLGGSGLPESFRVADGWLRSLGSEAFGHAVAEACEEALTGHGELWSEALEKGPATEERRSADPPTDPQVQDLVVMPRAPDEVLADVIDIIETPIPAPGTDLDADLDAGPLGGEGFTAFGRLTLTLRPDRTVSCHADPNWVSSREAEELTDDLNRALAAARADLAGRAGVGDPRVGTIQSELWALLIGAPIHARRTVGPADSGERQW